MTWLLGALGLAALSWLALTTIGQARWQRSTAKLEQRLRDAIQQPASAHFDPGLLQGLPAPVQRYFRAALVEGAPLVTELVIEHEGEFNVSERGARWRPFSSKQVVLMQRPGFVWDGRIRLLPGLCMHVQDAYVAGHGLLHPSLQGLFSIVRLEDDGALARDELMRFLAEAAWYPTALLPSGHLRWQAVDEHSADATLDDGPLSVTLRFGFGADGLIESVHAEARGRAVAGAMLPTPWEGRWFDAEWRDGMRVPTRGEVAWLPPEGRHVYWRGRVSALRYHFAAPPDVGRPS